MPATFGRPERRPAAADGGITGGNPLQTRPSSATRGGGATAGFRGNRGKPGYPVPDTLRLREEPEHEGTFFALKLPLDVAQQIAVPDGEKPEDMHITLFYQKGLTPEQRKRAAAVALELSVGMPIDVNFGGFGRFSASESSSGKDVIYVSVDSPMLSDLRDRLAERLRSIGIAPNKTHGYSPHVTVKYIDPGEKFPMARFNPVDAELGEMIIKESVDRSVRKFPRSIPHLEDMSPSRIGFFLEAIVDGRAEVTEKVDGSCALMFGCNEGKLWTSTKSGPLARSARAYEGRSEAAMAAHRALSARPIGKWMRERKMVEADHVFSIEVLYEDVPNSIEYNRPNTIVVNGILATGGVMRGRDGKRVFEDMVRSTGGPTVAGWTMVYQNDVTEDIARDVSPETFRLREGVHSEAWAHVRPRLMRRLAVMESAFGPAGVEGLVIRVDDQYAKVVDRQHFTRLNKFFWEWRERLERGTRRSGAWNHGVFVELKHGLAEAVGSRSLRSPSFVHFLVRNFRGQTAREVIESFCHQPNMFGEGYLDRVTDVVKKSSARLAELKGEWTEARTKGPVLQVEASEWRPARSVRMPITVIARTDRAFALAEERMARTTRALEFIRALPEGPVRQARTVTMAMGPRMLEGLERALGEAQAPDAEWHKNAMANVKNLVGIADKNVDGFYRAGIKFLRGADKYLGMGSYGVALEVDYHGRPAALKLTKDEHEAKTSNHLKGKVLKSAVHIFDVFRLRHSETPVYAIVMEKLAPLSESEKDSLSTLRDILDLTHSSAPMAAGQIKNLKQLRKHVAGEIKKHGIAEHVLQAFDEIAAEFDLDSKLKELAKHGVGFADIHSGNVLKRGNDFVFIDLGWGSKSPGSAPDMIERKLAEGKADTIGLTVGRFQPFHKGHAELVRKLVKEYTKVILVVTGNGVQGPRNPFTYDTRLEMINLSLPDVMNKVEVFKSDGPGAGYLPDIIAKISDKGGDEKSSLGRDAAVNVLVGADRVREFQAQFDRAKEKGFGMPVVVKALADVSNDGEDAGRISASKVRIAIAQNDKESFKKMVDPHVVSNEAAMDDVWDKFRDELKKVGPIKEKLAEDLKGVGGREAIDKILQANAELLKARKGIDPASLKFIGQGQEGVAYEIPDGRILKATADHDEAKASSVLKARGASLPNVVRVFDVFKFGKGLPAAGGEAPIFGIVTEKLQKLSRQEAVEFEELTMRFLDADKAKTNKLYDRALYQAYYGTYQNFLDAIKDIVSREIRTDLGIEKPDEEKPGQQAPTAPTGAQTTKSTFTAKTTQSAVTAPQGKTTATTRPPTQGLPARPAADLSVRAESQIDKEVKRLDAMFRKYQVDKMFQQLRSLGIKFADYHSGNLMKRGQTYVINDIGRSQSGGGEPPVLEGIVNAIIEDMGGMGDGGGGAIGGGIGAYHSGLRAGSSDWSGSGNKMTDDDEPDEGWWQSNLKRLIPHGHKAPDLARRERESK